MTLSHALLISVCHMRSLCDIVPYLVGQCLSGEVFIWHCPRIVDQYLSGEVFM